MLKYLLIILPAFQVCYGQQTTRLLNIQYGKHTVGLSQEEIVYNDSVRLLVSSWYPAAKNKVSNPLRIKETFFPGALNGSAINDSIVNSIICGDDYKINKDSLHQFLNIKTRTFLNALPLKRKFPAVMWSYRHGTEYYQFAMNELLASHGYIVFTVSRMQPVYVMPWETDAAGKMALHKSYLSDMNELLRRIITHPQAGTSHIVLFSWSYGGDGAIFFQQNHPEIDAVLGFSSIDFSNSFFLEKKIDSLLDTNRLNRPYYLFYEEISRRGNKFSEHILHPAIKKFSSLTLFSRLWHGNFNYLEGYVAGQLNLPVVQPWSKPGRDAITGYAALCRLALIHLKFIFENRNKGWLNNQVTELKKSLPDGFIK